MQSHRNRKGAGKHCDFHTIENRGLARGCHASRTEPQALLKAGISANTSGKDQEGTFPDPNHSKAGRKPQESQVAVRRTATMESPSRAIAGREVQDFGCTSRKKNHQQTVATE
ncbi:hypothetical protein CLAIMM_00561 isoform 3 [Cladophialophora immunda]|nr:hypothetical protein CLAIMM_00561 isoform 2 [Cladophialophora immunda]OQU94164.1 hypothetical protein CLAIMM_00561 isoform 3 [Cladophialophora immunda]